MKKLYSLLFILTLYLTVSAQKKVTDREFEGLIGSVKSVVYEEISLSEADRSNPKQKCFFCSESYYDIDGNLTQTVFPGLNYKSTVNIIDGFKTFKITKIVEKPKYNGFISSPTPREKPIEEPEKLFPPDERYNSKVVYEYDSQGRIKVRRNFQNNERLMTKSTYSYDNKGRIIEEIYETLSNKSYIVYKHDENGNRIEMFDKSQSRVGGKDNQSKIVYSDYKFDSQGNWIQRKEVATYGPFDKPFVTEIMIFRTIVYY